MPLGHHEGMSCQLRAVTDLRAQKMSSSLSPSVRGRNRTPPPLDPPTHQQIVQNHQQISSGQKYEQGVRLPLNTTSFMANSQPETKHCTLATQRPHMSCPLINQYTSVYTARNHVMCVHLPICDVIGQLSGQAGGAQWGSGRWGARTRPPIALVSGSALSINTCIRGAIEINRHGISLQASLPGNLETSHACSASTERAHPWTHETLSGQDSGECTLRARPGRPSGTWHMKPRS